MRKLLAASLMLTSSLTYGACDAPDLLAAYKNYVAAFYGMSRHDDPNLRGLFAEPAKVEFDRNAALREKQIAGGQPQQIQWNEGDDRQKMILVLMKAIRKKPPSDLLGEVSISGSTGSIAFKWSKDKGSAPSGSAQASAPQDIESYLSKASFQCDGHWLLVREEQTSSYQKSGETGVWKESWAFP